MNERLICLFGSKPRENGWRGTQVATNARRRRIARRSFAAVQRHLG